ncbi:MAG: hypothetical protein M3Z75_06440 [Actinomycetota bacterium]|nr:hypothetical protein [Actinomycetota bacterium]
MEGTFTGPFTHSPVGELEPNGARVVWDLMNMFRFDDRGRLGEEFVRTDNRSFLRQLGPPSMSPAAASGCIRARQVGRWALSTRASGSS